MKARLWKKLLWFSVSAIILAVLVCCISFWYSWKKNPSIEILDVTIIPEEIHIGDPIRIEIVTRLPWYRKPQKKIECEIPDGLQRIDNTKQNWIGLSWGKWEWMSILELQAYDFGPFRDLKTTVAVTPERQKENGTITVSIPEIVIKPRLSDSTSDLHMASELPEDFLRQHSSQIRKWLLISAMTIALVGGIVYLLVRRRPQKTAEAPKPWAVAESLIFALENRLPLDAETVFVELTDIVRRYIESVYDLPATERTTPEFLAEMKRDSTKLSADHGLLLVDFLTAADMVKFARLDATQSQIEDAIKKAKRFIVETSELIIRNQAS